MVICCMKYKYIHKPRHVFLFRAQFNNETRTEHDVFTSVGLKTDGEDVSVQREEEWIF